MNIRTATPSKIMKQVGTCEEGQTDMSAYICESVHISALACYAVDQRLWRSDEMSPDDTSCDQERLAILLFEENRKSVAFRYRNASELPGPDAAFKFSFVETTPRPAIEIIKAAQCFEYQSCEHPGWEKSPARVVIAAIIEDAIHRLPGYSKAKWGWETRDVGIRLDRL